MHIAKLIKKLKIKLKTLINYTLDSGINYIHNN